MLQGVCLYTLLFPLQLARLAPLSRLTAPRLFHFTLSAADGLLREKAKTRNLFLFPSEIHFRFVSGCPVGQYCLDSPAKCESGGHGADRTRRAPFGFFSVRLAEIATAISLLPPRGSAEQNKKKDPPRPHPQKKILQKQQMATPNPPRGASGTVTKVKDSDTAGRWCGGRSLKSQRLAVINPPLTVATRA